MMRTYTLISAFMLTIAAEAQTLNVGMGNVNYQFPASLTGEMTYTNSGQTLNVMGRTFTLTDVSEMSITDNDLTEPKVKIADEQQVGHESAYKDGIAAGSYLSLTSGLRLNFKMSNITHIELESVDANPIAGTGTISADGSLGELTHAKSIVTFSAPEGQTLQPGRDYYVTIFPSDLYGGYRLSIYKDGLVAHYFGVHQVAEAGQLITPIDLDESELEFDDPDAPLVEEERPELDNKTKELLREYKKNPCLDTYNALFDQMGVRYDKVVARKKAKLRELERDAHHQVLIDEMQAIVDEMVNNREERLVQRFLSLIDSREDDDPSDQWLVLKGATEGNAYVGYAPVTNEEWKAFNPNFTYPDGQDRYPVVNVSYTEAMAYCDWLSSQDSKHAYRLPTEYEWILAAGHMPKDVRMNADHIESGLTSVDAYDVSKGNCGGIDFWGNCWEWTSTLTEQGEYLVKGGAWDTSRDSCRSEYSDDSRDGSKGYANVGIRVVRVDK